MKKKKKPESRKAPAAPAASYWSPYNSVLGALPAPPLGSPLGCSVASSSPSSLNIIGLPPSSERLAPLRCLALLPPTLLPLLLLAVRLLVSAADPSGCELIGRWMAPLLSLLAGLRLAWVLGRLSPDRVLGSPEDPVLVRRISST